MSIECIYTQTFPPFLPSEVNCGSSPKDQHLGDGMLQNASMAKA